MKSRAGLYRCVDCCNAIFDSIAKLNSGTGLPNFREAIAGENVREKKDFNARVLRTEVMCALCDAHLGHVFTNGLEPTGLRYWMNSAALLFIPRKNQLAQNDLGTDADSLTDACASEVRSLMRQRTNLNLR